MLPAALLGLVLLLAPGPESGGVKSSDSLRVSPAMPKGPPRAGTAVPQSDSAQASKAAKDSALAPARTASPDTLAALPKSRRDSVVVVKHDFNHREQIITGSVIMSCLVLMLVTMNNYNPR